jgi:hypothetical protein
MGFFEPYGRGRRPIRHDALTGRLRWRVECADGSTALAGEAPVFVVHSLAHAIAVLTAAAEAGRPVVLLSAANAGIYAGPGWFRAMVEAACAEVPSAEFAAILDCGEDAGATQGAIRAGIKTVIFTGRADVAARLADIADQRGAVLLTARPAVTLDLAAMFFADAQALHRHCCDVLASVTRFC